MDDADAKQRVIDALMKKFIRGFRLQKLDALPAPAYGFNPDGWLLFVVARDHAIGASEYVAINPKTGKIRFLGMLGE
jgi:hypothetical protein